MSRSLSTRFGVAAGLLALAAGVLAQYQVNRQVNNRVNPELYGGGTRGSMRYSNSSLLPSESRYATWKSGALPSEVTMNARAIGPLAPSGSVAYVPGPSPVQQAMKLPQPQLYNPAYGIDASTGQKPISSGPINGQLPNGTIRYNPPAGPAPAALGAQPSWTQPMNKATPLPAVSPPSPSPSQITKPSPSGASSSPPPAANQAFYLSRLTPGSVRYSDPAATQPAN